jgi:hypothetical protein
MRYDTILTSSAGILTERGSDYGAPEKCFGRAAALASVFFEREVTPFEIAMVMDFVKTARLMHDKSKIDSWQDKINYVAFAGHFATETPRANPSDLGLRGINLPENTLPFAGKKSASTKTISEDALKQAMANVSAELDIPE